MWKHTEGLDVRLQQLFFDDHLINFRTRQASSIKWSTIKIKKNKFSTSLKASSIKWSSIKLKNNKLSLSLKNIGLKYKKIRKPSEKILVHTLVSPSDCKRRPSSRWLTKHSTERKLNIEKLLLFCWRRAEKALRS